MKKHINELLTKENATLRISEAFVLRVYSDLTPSHKKRLDLSLINANGSTCKSASIDIDARYDEMIKEIQSKMETLMNDYLDDMQRKLRGGLLYKNTINVIGGEDKAENKLKNMRLKMGMSQEELAYMSEVSYRSIRAYETGSRDISKASVTTLNKLAEALNCTVADLL